MAPQVVRIWNQMPEPKYCIAMGACSISGGPFKQGYNVLKGVDRYIPVDIYIPGCPPRPEALLNGLIELQKRIHAERLTGGVGVPRHLRKNDEVVSEWPVPAFGEHDLVPPRNDALTQRSEPLVRG
jgi:NADH-quinone oxidoreductase subunit B